MKKALDAILISPPDHYKEGNMWREVHSNFPPLGLASIASYSISKGHKVKIIDCNMTIASRRTNLKNIMREELPFTFGKGAVESIIGLDETNYEQILDQDSRIITLENNETIYQVFSYVELSASGQVPV